MRGIHPPLPGSRIAALLDRAYREWRAQRRKLIGLLPLLPRLLLGRKLDWGDMVARTKDLHLALEPEQGGLMDRRAGGVRETLQDCWKWPSTPAPDPLDSKAAR